MTCSLHTLRQAPHHPSISGKRCCTRAWRQVPSPASTRNVPSGSRYAMDDTLRCGVGAPDDVPSHVTCSFGVGFRY